MANHYCSECGEKHVYTLNKPKFCQQCGNPFGSLPKVSRGSYIETQDDSNIDQIPSIKKLDISVEDGYSKSRIISAKELFSNPLNPEELDYSEKKVNHKKMTLKEFSEMSRKQCAPDIEPKDVNSRNE